MKLVDPIAQTFYVQPSSGYFVTSIDLYFYSKDPTLQVTVQLRPTVYGQPAESFYQYSEVILTPDKINLSNDGSAATRVKFESPIYLEGETFHCICLSTNSDQYSVHISRLTEMDLSSSTMSSVFVTQQPLSGSFFNSQNGETWTPVQTDDLKFTLYRANFKASQGDINFYNSELGLANAQIATLNQNPLEINSREIRVGLGSTLTAPSLVLGNLVSQVDSTGTGTLINIAGIASGPLKVINSGIGYTPSSGVLTYTNVPLTTLSGSGTNATATITITNGSVTSVGASISNGGNGYKIGDVVTPTTIGASNLGANMRLSVQSIAGINELILDNVQGKFEVNNSNKTLYINSSGGQDLYFSGSVKAFPNNISVEKNGEIIKVNHQNHGMHSTSNKVKLSDISSDLGQTKLSTAVTNTSTTIVLASSENFNTFENLPVSATNPGYIQIGAEIISYTGVTGNTLTGITRSIDQTISSTYSVNDSVMKYELNGVSLRRINKTHTLSEGNNGLDYYNIKIDFSQAGNIATLPQGITNRGSDSTLGPLFFNRSESTGGNKVKATQNIPFEISRPLIDAKIHPGTNVISKIRTVSGTSISGNEVSYQDKGFSEFSLFENNYFNSPRLVASKVNEDSYLTTLPGKKSLTLNLQLNTTNSYISPTIDLQRVALSFTSNRINNLITNFELDSRVSSLNSDPSAFVYACLPIQIELPANALKIYITAHINNYSDIKCLYSISNNPDDPLVYYPFPGYNNIGSNNETLDLSKNSGLPDKNYIKENIVGFKPNEISYKEYVFTVNNLSPFRYYSIKLVGTSTNQAYPPRVKDLRVIALAGDV
jgi:hypothetical protein